MEGGGLIPVAISQTRFHEAPRVVKVIEAEVEGGYRHWMTSIPSFCQPSIIKIYAGKVYLFFFFFPSSNLPTKPQNTTCMLFSLLGFSSKNFYIHFFWSIKKKKKLNMYSKCGSNNYNKIYEKTFPIPPVFSLTKEKKKNQFVCVY